MSFFSRLFGGTADPKDELRPLWHAIVGEARNPAWYSECGAADTVDGRFDMITTVMALAMLRMEREPDLIPASARLTELFVDDMEGQLREAGLGDPALGKRMGKVMEAVGGRLGAYRTAIPQGPAAVAEALQRNSNFGEHGDPDAMAARLIAFSHHLTDLSRDQLLAGEIGQ